MSSDALTQAFEELAAACLKVAAELRRAPAGQTNQAQPRVPKASSSRSEPTSALEESSRGGSRRKVLVALAQYGRPMSKTQIALYAGLSATSGGLGQALADLRADGCIEGPGAANQLTAIGAAELGDWARLPEGNALFEHWCAKMGGSAEKVLRVLRKAQHPLSKSEIASAAGLSPTSGGLGQALADLRKMQLIEGHGRAMSLSTYLQRAIEPSVRVYEKNKPSFLVDARTGHKKDD